MCKKFLIESNGVFMKKFIHFLICGLIFAASIFHASCTESSSNFPDIVIWGENSLVKVKKDDSPPEKTSAELHLSAAKGEYESGQIILHANKSVQSVGVAVTDLVGQSGKVSADNVAVYAERYIFVPETAKPLNGWQPDALIPFDIFSRFGENKIEEKENFALYITVRVPYTVEAGVYNGKVCLTLDEETAEIPLALSVYDFSIPEENHAVTAFNLWTDDLCNVWTAHPDVHQVGAGNEAGVKKLLETYYEFFNGYRINLMDLPLTWNELKNPALVVEAMEKAVGNPRVSAYRIPVSELPDSSGINTYALKNMFTEMIRKSANETDLFKKAYLYIQLIDEPVYQKIVPLANKVNKQIKDLKTELLNDSTLWSGKEQVKASFAALPNLLTEKYTEELTDVDAWCVKFDELDAASRRDFYYNLRQEEQQHLWWYGCVTPKNPYPTFHINDHLASARSLGWMQKAYKVEGQLYYCVNLSRKIVNGAFTQRDIWTDPESWEGVCGDGFLIYPGEKYGLDAPLPTVRLATLRDGFEDYEYLWLYENAEKRLSELYETSTSNELSSLYAAIFNGTKPTNDPDAVISARNTLASLLELAEKDVYIQKQTDGSGNNVSFTVYAPESCELSFSEKAVSVRREGNAVVYCVEAKGFALSAKDFKTNKITIANI